MAKMSSPRRASSTAFAFRVTEEHRAVGQVGGGNA